ncbi:PepSY domain-containing protein [Massilia sp. Root351]|uniref:PepSY-associated TM helix domain-containing protein n=1 Tax=Massilia sp. Root351 TaxID=1736522 RepID=UPI0009E99156|nr:PepSY-associated TM helix domain-containing protein [Massilia sp. Root351]
MKESFRQSMAWLHTWSGLLVCWILFLVFTAGTASYFRDEISLWMKPELHAVQVRGVAAATAAEVAVRALQERAPEAKRWFITLPTDRTPAVRIAYTDPDSSKRRLKSALIDPASGMELKDPRETRGGEFIYRLHFDLHYMPAIWARWIVGFCAMFMLVSILSGVITHKRIFKDFFTFRGNKGQRSWLDAHNATAVLALPYHLMITYTGLVTLMFLYMPAATQAAYKGDREAMTAEVFPSAGKPVKPAGVQAPLAAIRPIVEQAESHWGGRAAGGISVTSPNDANARISVTRAAGRELSSKQPAMQFDGASGALLAQAGDDPSGAAATHGVMYGLHIARFAGPLLRAFFFISGLAGCAMVATGALLWAVKSRQRQAKTLKAGGKVGFGTRLVEALNLGAIAGLPIAYGVYFWANRLVPVGLEKRPETEIAWFFAAWGAAMVLAQIRPDRLMWRLQLGAGALLLMGIPVLNVFTTSSHLGVTMLQSRGPVAVAGFDLTVFALGLLLACAAHRLGRSADKAVPAAKAGGGSPARAAALAPAPLAAEAAAPATATPAAAGSTHTAGAREAAPIPEPT